MMKIDVTQYLRQFDGEPIYARSGTLDEIGLCEECRQKANDFFQPLTLRLTCTRSLVAITERSMKLEPQKKFERAQLATKIHNNNPVSLTAEEITMVKEAIGQVEGPLALMRAWDLLDPPDDVTGPSDNSEENDE